MTPLHVTDAYTSGGLDKMEAGPEETRRQLSDWQQKH